MYNEISVRTNMLRSIEFRSKFVKQIQNLPEETQEGLKKVAIRFVNDENDDKCLDILWRMTYDPETALNMLGISIENDAILDDEAEKKHPDSVCSCKKLQKRTSNPKKEDSSRIHGNLYS